jgi:hypothetical protein
MRGRRFACAALVLVPSLAWAQAARPPSESVTVTGIKSREVLQKFVGSLAAPTRLTGKVARWTSGICPAVVGVPPEFAKFMNRRLKEVASQAGAPVNNSPSCRTNIVIVFSANPQRLADDISKKRPALLGYFDNSKQEKALATVTHLVQAWYMTATRDVQGGLLIDNAKPGELLNRMEFPCPPPFCSDGKITLYPPRVVTTTGLRLGDGLRSEFYNIVIVADRAKLLDFEMGELSDYIAMLALTQLGAQGGCVDLPSITSLLAENCASKSGALTQNDLAFLRGLYKMSPDKNLGLQRDEISYRAEQELTGH